ncbi:hypothetical protein RQP46_009461 [Phenoliferia psychrophenolica]
MAPTVFPAWDDIAPVEGMRHGCMWGFFDKDGVKDNIGTLNLLTPENLVKAREEIVFGDRVQVDWPLDHPSKPTSGRKCFEHKILHFDADPLKPGLIGNDDEIHINTQSTSQWDGFKHLAIQDGTGRYYNGLTQDEIKAGTDGGRLGIHHCGIAGRGILLDWVSWYEKKHGKAVPAPYFTYRIPISELEEVAAYQNTEFRQGDILLIRTGFSAWYDNPTTTDEERLKYMTHNNDYIGVDAGNGAERWFYDKHFSAVAADTLSFEAWPNPAPALLHEWFLVQSDHLHLQGTPIGEFWELDKLAEVCKLRNKYSFFFTSAPLRIPKGVASPPNAICIL